MFGRLCSGKCSVVKTPRRKGGLSIHLCQVDGITHCAIACVLSLSKTKNRPMF